MCRWKDVFYGKKGFLLLAPECEKNDSSLKKNLHGMRKSAGQVV